MKHTSKILAMTALAASLLSSQAFAADATANMEASARINSSCVVSADPMNFGSITPAATGDATTTGKITAICSNDTRYTLSLSKGTGSSITNRSMAGSASNTDRLNYNVYLNPSATAIFGDGTEGDNLFYISTGTTYSTTIYGKLALNQYVKPDSYLDTLTVALDF